MRLRTDSMICPACGKENKPSATKCVVCRQRLKDNEEGNTVSSSEPIKKSGQQPEEVELIHKLKQTVETQQKELEKSQQQIVKATGERDQLKQRLEAVEQEHGLLKNQIQQLTVERDQLKQRLEVAEQEQGLLKKQIQQLTTERDQLKQGLVSAQQEQTLLRKQIQQVTVERDQLKQRLEAVEQEFDRIVQERDFLKKQIEEVTIDRDQLKQKIEEQYNLDKPIDNLYAILNKPIDEYFAVLLAIFMFIGIIYMFVWQGDNDKIRVLVGALAGIGSGGLICTIILIVINDTLKAVLSFSYLSIIYMVFKLLL